MRSRRTLLLAISPVILSLSSCKTAGERALPMVQESGDHALAVGDYDKATKEFGEVVMRRPGYWEDRLKYAKALLGAGRPALAREQMEILYTSRPNDFKVLNTLAQALLAAGEVSTMSNLLREEAYARGKASDWLRYGWFMALAGDADEGERALKKAAETDRGMGAGPQIALGELYKAAGDNKRALERFRMAQYCEPHNLEIKESIEKLGEDSDPRLSIAPVERGYPSSAAAGK